MAPFDDDVSSQKSTYLSCSLRVSLEYTINENNNRNLQKRLMLFELLDVR